MSLNQQPFFNPCSSRIPLHRQFLQESTKIGITTFVPKFSTKIQRVALFSVWKHRLHETQKNESQCWVPHWRAVWARRDREPAERTDSYHDGVDDVVVVVLQGAYRLRPRHVGLWHDQFDVLDLNAGLINLSSQKRIGTNVHARLPQPRLCDALPPPLRSPPVLLASACFPGCSIQLLPGPWTSLPQPAELAGKDLRSRARQAKH